MSSTIDRVRAELIRAKVLRNLDERRQERIVADVAEAIRRDGLLRSEPEKPLPDVPLHKRGFGVMDEAVPHATPTPRRRRPP